MLMVDRTLLADPGARDELAWGRSCAGKPIDPATAEQPRTRVWVLTNAPSPYQVELLSKIRETQPIDLAVRFMRVPEAAVSRLDALLPAAFCELWGAAPRRWRDEFRLHPRALREAAFGRYDCYVLSGLYTSITFLLCAIVLSVRRKPWAIWLERPHAEKYRLQWGRSVALGRIISGMKSAAMQFLLRFSHRVIGMGTAAVNAYAALGADRRKLSMLPYCCDVDRFTNVDLVAIERVREKYGLDGKTAFLFSGQMIERKGVDVVLRAFEQVAARYPEVALLMVGDGKLRCELEQHVPDEVRQSVHFTGWLDQSELPAHFAAADVFVFPSRHDGWAVVINEACGAGLPIVVSHQTGAALDLVKEDRNGFVLDCEDVSGFADKMAWFHEHPEQIQEFGKHSRAMVQPFSTELGAVRFRNYVAELIDRGRH